MLGQTTERLLISLQSRALSQYPQMLSGKDIPKPRPSSESKCLPASPATSWKLELPGSSELVLDNTHPKPQEEDYDNHASCSGGPSPLQQHLPSQRFPSTLCKTTQWVSTALILTASAARRIETTSQEEKNQPPCSVFWECCLGQPSAHTTASVHSPTLTLGA